MDCPECGTPLVTYRLEEREAPVCEQCGHVGIDAEHRPARVRVESWGDALRRFYGTTEDVSVHVPVHSDDWEPSRRARAETWATALERFYRPTADADASAEGTEAADDGAVETGSKNGQSKGTGPARVPFDGQRAVRRADERE